MRLFQVILSQNVHPWFRKRTIHNKYGGVTAVDPIAEAEERKARIRNNCL